ncbi:hypothetical protein NMY22_g166 [Coprinellus aureogranulatus]|nr:hypothetical protein NMY22_g166 [Coprinellus aureogranulatus]
MSRTAYLPLSADAARIHRRRSSVSPKSTPFLAFMVADPDSQWVSHAPAHLQAPPRDKVAPFGKHKRNVGSLKQACTLRDLAHKQNACPGWAKEKDKCEINRHLCAQA